MAARARQRADLPSAEGSYGPARGQSGGGIETGSRGLEGASGAERGRPGTRSGGEQSRAHRGIGSDGGVFGFESATVVVVEILEDASTFHASRESERGWIPEADTWPEMR